MAVQTKDDTTLEIIYTLLEEQDYEQVHKLLQELLAEDIAFILDHINKDHRLIVFEAIQKHANLAKIIRAIDSQALDQLIAFLSNTALKSVFSKLDSAETANIVETLPVALQERVWEVLGERHEQATRAKLDYKEDEAGRIMSSDFFLARPDSTVFDTILKIKESSNNQECSYSYVYIATEDNLILGVVSLHDLIRKPNDALLKNIMRTEVVSAATHTDREEVAHLVERYNITALPIVNDTQQIVGIITVDDIIDVIRAEATEDLMKLAGTTKEDIILQSPFHSFIHRLPWLIVSFFGGLLTIQSNLFFGQQNIPIQMLAFVTIIAGMGGNIASQSSIIVIRGIATGKFLMNQFSSLLLREVASAILLGSFFGIALGVFTHFHLATIARSGLAVGLGMLCSVILAATVGTLMPIFFYKMNVDPAVATGPFVSTTIDNIGLVTYFSITLFILQHSFILHSL